MSEMDFHIGGRSSGKTSRLLQWLGEAPEDERRIIVTHSRDEANALYEAALKRGLKVDAQQFTTVDVLRRGAHHGVVLHSRRRLVLGIDNLDLILPSLLCGCPVGRVTATGTLASFDEQQTRKDFEHTGDLVGAQKALRALRKHAKRMHHFSGGRGYDNMGRRELEQVRVKVDEAEFWLSAAAQALNAGGKRAVSLGLWPKRFFAADAAPKMAMRTPDAQIASDTLKHLAAWTETLRDLPDDHRIRFDSGYITAGEIRHLHQLFKDVPR